MKKKFALAAILCLAASVSSSLVCAQQAAGKALAPQPRAVEDFGSAASNEQGARLVASIQKKWADVMRKIKGWDESALQQFREGYRNYPVWVLGEALAARSFEEMLDALDAHATVLAQGTMAKAFPKGYAMDVTAPEDASNEQVVEAKKLVAKTLGDDARDLVFIPVTPCTVWDTRFATNPASAGIIANGQTKEFYSHLDGAGGSYAAYGGNPSCPETSQNAIGFRPFAVMMTVYISDATAQGWLTLYRDGDPDPSNATISVYYSPGPTRTQTVISKSSRGYGTGAYDIAATSRFGSTNASASVTGYFLKAVVPGSVTSITAGTGLTGGTITSTGTIAIATAYQLPQACATNQVAKWNGSAWICAADLDTNSGGTVTGVTASAPLASSGGNTPNISLTGTISVANGGTGQTTLATNGILYGQGTSAVANAVGAAGQVLTGTAGAPTWTGSPWLAR